MINYTPSPIDTSDIVLSQDLIDLAEKMAENVHEVWAEQRTAQGWTYGPKRDDGKLETPCLVSYQDLSESEKEYDRSTALSTLQLIIKLGYKITKG